MHSKGILKYKQKEAKLQRQKKWDPIGIWTVPVMHEYAFTDNRTKIMFTSIKNERILNDCGIQMHILGEI